MYSDVCLLQARSGYIYLSPFLHGVALGWLAQLEHHNILHSFVASEYIVSVSSLPWHPQLLIGMEMEVRRTGRREVTRPCHSY